MFIDTDWEVPMEPIKDSLEDLLDQVAFEIAREVEAGRLEPPGIKDDPRRY